ncbi:MAG: ABC transporter ATP-binding protein [Terrimicrobiaceae bacterium]
MISAVEPLRCEGLTCSRATWREGQPSKVSDFSCGFRDGELCGVVGPDGCGKGLLLNMVGLLERPDAGDIFADGWQATGRSGEEIIECRNRFFGFLFSRPTLLPGFTVAENVAMPLFRICGVEAGPARRRTMEVLEFCGVGEFCSQLADRIPEEAQDLAALARALVHQPRVLIAISPKRPEGLLPIARRAAEEFGLCVIWGGEVATVGPFAHRVVEIAGGRMVSDQTR